MLIQNGVDVNAAIDRDNNTLLHYAAAVHGHHVDVAYDVVLIQNGVDVNAVDKDNETSLHRAVAVNRHVDVAKALIQNGGVDVNAVNKDNENAAANGHVLVFVLQLLCFGAVIDENALEDDETGLLVPINDRMNLLRAGKRPL